MRLSTTTFMLLLTFAFCLLASKVTANRKGEKDCEDDDNDEDHDNDNNGNKTNTVVIGSSTIWSATVWPVLTNSDGQPQTSKQYHSSVDYTSGLAQSSLGSPQPSNTGSSGATQPSATYSSGTPQSSVSYPQELSLTSSASQPSVYNSAVSVPGSVTATWSHVASTTPTTGGSDSQVGSMARYLKICRKLLL